MAKFTSDTALQFSSGVKSVEIVLFPGCWRAGLVGGVVSTVIVVLEVAPVLFSFPALSTAVTFTE